METNSEGRPDETYLSGKWPDWARPSQGHNVPTGICCPYLYSIVYT